VKPFKFRLQVLLDVHEREKESLFTQLTNVREHISELQTKTQELQSIIQNGVGSNLQVVSQAQSFYNYVSHIQQVLAQNKTKLIEYEKEEEILVDLVRSVQNKIKVLTKLKEKKQSAFQKEFTRKEQQFLDELGTRGFQQL